MAHAPDSNAFDDLASQAIRVTQIRHNPANLQFITDALPVLVSYIGPDQRYRFANRAYERWFGLARSEIVGQHMEQVLGASAYSELRAHVEAALRGEEISLRSRVAYARGGERFVSARYVPDIAPDGSVLGFIALISDISDEQGAIELREAAALRTERLLKVTAAMAEAVDATQVLETLVDRVAEAIGASSLGLWLLSADGSAADLARSVGYSGSARARISSVPVWTSPTLPVIDAIRQREPLWIKSRADLLVAYPHLAPLTTPGSMYSIACLPLMVRGQPRGCLGFTFEDERVSDKDERDFLLLVARYSGQALERVRLLETERASRARAEAAVIEAARLHAANEQGRARTELLYELAAAVIRASTVEEVFEGALDGIERALGASRCSILTFDPDGVMRFRAFRGLSPEYRRAVEGHSPWSRQAVHPEPIVVPDVYADRDLSAYQPLFQSERIGALGFIPLVWEGRLIGKFMVYYPEPRDLSPAELEMAKAIANHIAAAIGRFSALAELQQTVRFNEIFTGMLGHDLRNPLGAIMAGAHIAMRRAESEQLTKPLSRILSSGARMARMIDQLLDFTRMRLGTGFPLDQRETDMVPIVRQVIDELCDAHPAHHFRLEGVDGDTRGSWDADRISQVFSNLVANAVQHGTDARGVAVRIDGQSPEFVRVDVENGGMVPSDVLPRLFEPMAGGDRRREKSQGIGLGLYISREIVRAHGGSIDVSTCAQTGTRFSVCLPRASARPKPRPRGSSGL